MPVLYLTEADVQRLLTMDMAIEAVEASFRKLALDEAQNVPRQRCQTDQVMLHVLPAAAKTLNTIGFKAYTTTKNKARFHVTLFDAKTGALTAILEADLLGRLRTGAASGVATKLLARPDAATVGLLGTGKQARTQLQAMCCVREIHKAYVFSRDEERRTAFAREMSAECGVEVVPVASAEAAVRDRDIIITITSSREPVLFGEWLSKGQHLNIAGSNLLGKKECDAEVFRRVNLVTVDSKDQARLEAGDFVEPLRNGELSWANVLELAPILVGRYSGREESTDITLFKSLGLGIEDIAVGAKVLDLARKEGVGQELPIPS